MQLARTKSQKLFPNYPPCIWRELQSAQLMRSDTDFDTDFGRNLPHSKFCSLVLDPLYWEILTPK